MAQWTGDKKQPAAAAANTPDASARLPETKLESEVSPTDAESQHSATPPVAAPVEQDPTILAVGPPPDGGLVAWCQVIAGHLVVFNTWGFVISFGIFQPYYVEILKSDASAVAWIGSTEVCLILLAGVFSGRLFDAGYCKSMLLLGSTLQLVGTFTASVSTTYWQLFLSQGLCGGIGCGVCFAPTIANVSSYFTTKRTMAISLGACGGAVGGIIFPLMARQLLPHISLGWTLRAMGLVQLVAYVIVHLLVRTRLPPRKSGALVDWPAFKELPYSLFAVGMFFTLWAIFFSYFYARAYALDRLHGTASTSFNMLMVINAIGIPGRLVPAYLADKYFDALTVLIPTVFGASVCIFAWAGVSSIPGQYVWIIFIGYFGAGIQSLFPSTIASLTRDLSKAGTRLGMIFAICSIPNLTGPPLAGRLISAAGGSYIGAQIWGGCCLLIGACLLFAARIARTRMLAQFAAEK